MAIIQFTGNQHIITIPKEIMDLKGWKKGQLLYFKINDETLEVGLVTAMERMMERRS